MKKISNEEEKMTTGVQTNDVSFELQKELQKACDISAEVYIYYLLFINASLQVNVRDRIIRFLHMDLNEVQSQYSSCYGEVVKQEKALDTLRDSNTDLRVEIVNLEQDIGILEFQLSEKLKILDYNKERIDEMEKALEKNELLKTIKDQSKAKKWECKVAQLKSSFDTVVKRNTALEKEINLLKQTLIDKSEVQTPSSPAEVNNCMNTFKSLQERMSSLNKLLKEKSEDLAHVQAGYQVLQNELEIAKEQYNSLEASANEEEENLKCEIKVLEEKLQNSEREYNRVMEDDKRHQELLMEAANHEIRLQNEFTEKEKVLMEKLQVAQAEETRLSNTLGVLDKELQTTRCELAERDAQLQAVANQNQRLVHTIEKLQNDVKYSVLHPYNVHNLIICGKKIENKDIL
ncbi:hypothetical protein C0J52_08392 [Blattella germanica]|nr:hypothetical protein C0J52_08392 [Blattella germanica]